MSALVDAELDGQKLGEEDLLGFCFVLIVAGNDTTTNLIANGAVLLAEHPEQRAALARDPAGIPNNLMPYVMQVAVGKLAELSVFGDDYDTPDGTGVRDYIHVVDLARGHVAALAKLAEEPGVHTWNLGTGNGTSVLEIVAAASRAVGHDIPYKVVGRRDGDLGTCFADPTKAQEDLNWRAERIIDNMVHDHWNWQRDNPDGFGD